MGNERGMSLLILGLRISEISNTPYKLKHSPCKDYDGIAWKFLSDSTCFFEAWNIVFSIFGEVWFYHVFTQNTWVVNHQFTTWQFCWWRVSLMVIQLMEEILQPINWYRISSINSFTDPFNGFKRDQPQPIRRWFVGLFFMTYLAVKAIGKGAEPINIG